MQILQRLFRSSPDIPGPSPTTTRSLSNRFLRGCSFGPAEEQAKQRSVVFYVDSSSDIPYVSLREDEAKDHNLRRDGYDDDYSGKKCFYGTLSFRQLTRLYSREDFWGVIMGGQKGEKAAAAATVGCKVLPICDISMIGRESFDGSEKSSTAVHSEGRRTVSRMKELLKWAATAKSTRGGSKAWKVLYFRHRAAAKSNEDDEYNSKNSSKISIRWDVGSCSTTSSVYSPLSMASASRPSHIWMTNSTSILPIESKNPDSTEDSARSSKTEDCATTTGHWITTDSDFVVLEL